MAKERLSKLQKWILVRAYENKEEHENPFGNYTDYCLKKRCIYEEYFNIKIARIHGYYDSFLLPKNDKKVKTIQVVLSRSLKKLESRGYIKPENYRFSEACEHKTRFGATGLKLTEEGIEKTKQLLKYNSGNCNPKLYIKD